MRLGNAKNKMKKFRCMVYIEIFNIFQFTILGSTNSKKALSKNAPQSELHIPHLILEQISEKEANKISYLTHISI